MADQGTLITQVIAQRIGNFVIKEIQQAIPRVNQIHLHAQASKDRSVFTANNTGTVNNQGTWRMLQVKNGVGVVNPRMSKIDIGWAPWA